jgi:hypothetical protein
MDMARVNQAHTVIPWRAAKYSCPGAVACRTDGDGACDRSEKHAG